MQTVSGENGWVRDGGGAIRQTESKAARLIGKGLGTVAIAFLAFDAAGKLFEAQPVMEATVRLGYPPELVFGLGVTLGLCVLCYAVPRTSVLGALLLTGYLGGAVAAQVRVGGPLFTNVLFPTYIAAFLWGSLLLRNARLRALLPWGVGGDR